MSDLIKANQPDLIQEIQPDFSFNSNYNEKSNESSVRFGANAPVLEAELNELQEIQNRAKEDLIRDSIPSGFTVAPIVNMTYTTDNIDKLRINNTPVAYVNGYRIEIPSTTLIDIGLPPEKDIREDLVFLEVWREVVDGTSTLTMNGGEGLATIPNNIIDPREGVETSRRVVTKWRIRCIQDMNFNYRGHESTIGSCPIPYIGWNNESNFSKAYAKGGNASLELPKSIQGREIFRGASSDWNNSTPLKDNCLWIAGLKGEASSIERYKTVDGLVFAIPMFKLIRRPSTGVLKGDYISIAPSCDYDKVQNILAEEKVSGIKAGDIDLELEGKTFKNLFDFAKFKAESIIGNEVYSYSGAFITNVQGRDDRQWSDVKSCANLKPNTDYTLLIFAKSSQDRDMKVQWSCNRTDISNVLITPTMDRKLVYTFNSGDNSEFLFKLYDSLYDGNARPTVGVVLLEGVQNANSINKPFVGLFSSGEDLVAFSKFISWKDTITPPSSGTTNLASFDFKPKTNLVRIIPVNANGKEIGHPSIAYQLQDAEGSKVAQSGSDISIALTDSQRDSIKKAVVFYNNFAPQSEIIGFNVYDGYSVKLRSNFRNEKESILEVNLKEPLRAIPNTDVRDRLAVNGIVNRQTLKTTLDGSENWQDNQSSSNSSYFLAYTLNKQSGVYSKVMNNKFNTYDNVSEGINKDEFICQAGIAGGIFYLSVKKSRLDTPDVAGLKKWLQANPIEVIYKKAQYEPLNLILNGVADIDDGQGQVIRNIKMLRIINEGRNIQVEGNNQATQVNTISFLISKKSDELHFSNEALQCNTNVNLPSKTATELYANDMEGVSLDVYNFRIKIARSKLATQDVAGLTKYIQDNNMILRCQRNPIVETYSTEQAELVGDLLFNDCDSKVVCDNAVVPKINLTHKANMNVDLFEGYTKVACNSSIQPTITVKDQVGIGSIELNLSEDENDVPVKIEGKTYQNLLKKTNNAIFRTTYWSNGFSAIYDLSGKAITLLNLTHKPIVFQIKNITTGVISDFTIKGYGVFKTVLTDSRFWNIAGVVGDGWENTNEDKELYEKSVILLEDNYANEYTPNYFEGIKSVGNLDDDILNIISTGKNLFDPKNYASNNGVLVEYIDDGYVLTGTADWKTLTYRFKVQPNTKYFLKLNKEFISGDKGTTLVVKDGDNKIIDDYKAEGKYGLSEYSFTPKSRDLTIIIFASTSASSKSKVTNIMLSKEDIPYEPYKGSIKSLSLGVNRGLNSLPNGVCDTIEQVGEKFYLTQKVGKIVLEGSGNEVYDVMANTNEVFIAQIDCNGLKLSQTFVSNHPIKYEFRWSIKEWETTDYIGANFENTVGKLTLIFPKERYTTLNDINSFKQWLKANPITICYQLAEPTVSELTTNLITEEREATFGLAGQVGYKRTVEGSIFAESILLTQSLNPNWHQVGETRKYKFTLNRGNALDLLEIPLIPASQLGNNNPDSLACPYKVKIIKVLPNNECLVKNIGKNAVGGQAEQFVAPQFLNTRIFKEDIDEIYPKVSLTGWDYNQVLEETLLKILK